MPFGPPKYMPGQVQSQPLAPMGFDETMAMLNATAPKSAIQAPKDRGMFGRFKGFNPMRFDPDKGVGEGNRLYALGAMLAGMGTGDPALTANLLEPKLQQNRERVQARDEEAKRQQMMQQLGQMPGVTDQQRALLGMGLGAEQMVDRAFATGQKPMVVNGRVVDPSDPSKILADYSDPKLPPGMMVNPETGRPEYIPEYIQGQKAIAEARGGNQNNVQSVFTGEDGMQYIVRRDGSLEPLGVRARNPFQITDVGGVPMAIDRQTGAGIPVTSPETVAQNKATIATVTANEEARRQAQQDLPKAVATFDRGIATLEALKSSPGFDTRYGLMSVIPVIPGTDMADTQALINQIGGQAFLTAFESLKGGGQITEVEGQKATQAITVLTTQGIRPQTAAKAIEDLIEVQRAAKARAASQAQGRYADPGANAPTLKYNPQTGEFE